MKIRDTQSMQEKNLNTSKKVRIYLCGVTVYDDSHIGHARTIIVFDVLRRYAESKGAQVELVQNFTDVDDKIIDRAKTEGVSAAQLGSRYIERYYEEFDRLGTRRATEYPKATEHISEMQDLIKDLIDRNIAYVSKNGVYFAVSKFPEYGKLSKKNTDELLSGARVKVDEDKQNPLDFALWKFSDSDPSWESPWGKGRPGWHIECSAMSLKYLGADFEIHGGGRDLIFPHHENEIAQSEAHTQKPLAKIWMHVGMVTINGEKMSKSLGNIKSVRNLLSRWSPNVIRLFCIGGHYSKPIDYSEDLLTEHENNWNRARLAYYKLIQCKGGHAPDGLAEKISQVQSDFDAALDDNLNTHLALGAFYKLAALCLGSAELSEDASKMILPVFEKMLDVFGLQVAKVTDAEKSRYKEMISKRDEMREQKKYDEADKIRDELASEGIEIIDESQGTIWLKSEQSKS